jgi:antitoxin (DNA-binding transcriptional repressor) of toxin-antitoxin stability system
MRTVTVREVRQQFSRKVEAPLRRGETLIIRKRNKEVLGRIVPEVSREKAYPDFALRQEKIFGNQPPRLNVTEFLKKQRGRF